MKPGLAHSMLTSSEMKAADDGRPPTWFGWVHGWAHVSGPHQRKSCRCNVSVWSRTHGERAEAGRYCVQVRPELAESASVFCGCSKGPVGSDRR
jgi:hypothetical protein